MATNFLKRFNISGGQTTDLMVGVLLLGVLAVMIIAVSPALLSLLLSLSLAISLVILLVAFYIENPLQFSTFPSLLLMVTVFRLALNVASTKLILSSSTAANLQGKAGAVIEFFGKVVAHNQPVVGLVVFLILVLIQFIVITKGAGRIAEVAARFTLDAMPGKQMAIDADLNAGLITETQARQRRTDIAREADFYGAMDGASKFVRGDAIAGLLITAINIVGGMIVGLVQEQRPFLEVGQTYTILTIGDGLVTQIPALLVSFAAGIVVTRAASEASLGQSLSRQILARPQALFVAAGALLLLAVMSLFTGGGFGIQLPFLIIAGVLGFGGYRIQVSEQKQVQVRQVEEKRKREAARGPEPVESLLAIDLMEMEIGYALIPLVDAEQGGDLLDRIALVRRNLATELGLVVPPVRIRDNMQLTPNHYVVRIRGVRVAEGEIFADRLLAMPSAGAESIPGQDTREPAFGLPAKWILSADRARAELGGYNIVEPSAVLATHVSELIKRHAAEILDRQSVQSLVDHLKKHQGAVVDELIPDLLPLGQVQKVLRNLLQERISIRDLGTIFEALSDTARQSRDIGVLTEAARRALARSLTERFADKEGNLPVLTIEPRLEQTLAAAVRDNPEGGSYLALEPNATRQLVQRVQDMVADAHARGVEPVLLTSPQLRPYLRRLIERFQPQLAVVSYNEIVPEAKIKSVGIVRWERESQEVHS